MKLSPQKDPTIFYNRLARIFLNILLNKHGFIVVSYRKKYYFCVLVIGVNENVRYINNR